jgi:hypothetical protein
MNPDETKQQSPKDHTITPGGLERQPVSVETGSIERSGADREVSVDEELKPWVQTADSLPEFKREPIAPPSPQPTASWPQTEAEAQARLSTVLADKTDPPVTESKGWYRKLNIFALGKLLNKIRTSPAQA